MHYDQSYECYVKYIGLKKCQSHWQHSWKVRSESVTFAPVSLWFECNWVNLGQWEEFCCRENNELTLHSVETLLRKRREEITAEIFKNWAEHVKQVEHFYWKTDRIIDQKMNKLEINLDSNEDESDMETDSYDDAWLLIVIERLFINKVDNFYLSFISFWSICHFLF